MPKNANHRRRYAKQVPAPAQLRWDDLRVLLALGREGTLSGAASRLGVNTSTIARRLDAMEAGLDLHLFDRTSAGVAATEVAESLLPVAEAMERAADDALRLVEGRETEPEGVVRITAPPGIANWWIAPCLVRLRQRFPRLRVELAASVGYADLTRREADIALRASRPSSGDLVAVRLTRAQGVVVAAPSLCERLGRVSTLDALDWITWDADLAHLPDARWIAANVSTPRIALRTSSMDAQIHAARAGLGAMLIPEPFAGWTALTPVSWTPTLRRRLPPLPTGSLWMVGHRALRTVPRVQAVWEFLMDHSAGWR